MIDLIFHTAESTRNKGWLSIVTVSCLTFLFQACTRNENQQSLQGTQNSPSALIQKGRTIYQTQCIACHNANPQKPGSIGPDVYGSSRELIEARIMRAEYPPQYQPKRNTHTMAPLPHLKGEIDAIHAYLNSKSL